MKLLEDGRNNKTDAVVDSTAASAIFRAALAQVQEPTELTHLQEVTIKQ